LIRRRLQPLPGVGFDRRLYAAIPADGFLAHSTSAPAHDVEFFAENVVSRAWACDGAVHLATFKAANHTEPVRERCPLMSSVDVFPLPDPIPRPALALSVAFSVLEYSINSWLLYC